MATKKAVQDDGWNVVSTSPVTTPPAAGDGWNVVSTAPVPKAAAALDVSNPNNEGTYKMVGRDGATTSVPFSKVRGAQDQGFAVQIGPEGTRYAKDAKAASPGNGQLDKLAGWGEKTFPQLSAQDYQDMTPQGQSPAQAGAARFMMNTGGKVARTLAGAPAAAVDGFKKFVQPDSWTPVAQQQQRKRELAGGMVIDADHPLPEPTGGDISDAGSDAAGGAIANYAMAKLAGGLVKAPAKALAKVAPLFAESAMGVKATDRAYGRQNGNYILDETKGISPRGVQLQTEQNNTLFGKQLNTNADNSPTMVNLQPARDTAASLYDTADSRNNASTAKDVAKIGQQLDSWGNGKRPIPQFVTARQGLELNRGLGDLRDYSPTAISDFTDRAVDGTRAALHPELSSAIPQFDELNSKLSTGLRVAKLAKAKDLNAGILQKSVGRFGALTGALTPVTAGAGAGYALFGLPGAAVGGTAGLFGPALMESPEAGMAAARTANNVGGAGLFGSKILNQAALPLAVTGARNKDRYDLKNVKPLPKAK